MTSPNSIFKKYWDYFIMFVAAYNCFALPIEIAFKSPILLSPAMNVINYIMDFVFLLDMIVVFRTTIFLEE